MAVLCAEASGHSTPWLGMLKALYLATPLSAPPNLELDFITSIAIVVSVFNILFVLWLFSDLVRSERLRIFSRKGTESPGIVLAMITLIVLTIILIIVVLLE
jgi:hypothetical protein